MLRSLVPLLLAVSLAVPVSAQSELVSADSVEVAGHLVTEAELARFAGVVNRMDGVFQCNPRAFAGLEWKSDEPVTLAWIGGHYESNAAMRAALSAAGMTGREFIVTLAALVEAYRAMAMEDPSLLESLSPAQAANLRLATSRDEEIGRLFEIIRTVRTED